MALNKEQSFLFHEFIRDNAEEPVWKTQEDLLKMVSEVLAASTFQVEEEVGFTGGV
jgi:hypothetical protein